MYYLPLTSHTYIILHYILTLHCNLQCIIRHLHWGNLVICGGEINILYQILKWQNEDTKESESDSIENERIWTEIYLFTLESRRCRECGT